MTDALGRAHAPRAGPDQGLRALRVLPADVPELRGVRGGDGLAARADRADADRPRGGQRGLAGDDHAPRPLPRLHGVRDRVPVGRAVRPADRARAAADRAPRPAPGASALPAGDLRAVHPPGRLRAAVPFVAPAAALQAPGAVLASWRRRCRCGRDRGGCPRSRPATASGGAGSRSCRAASSASSSATSTPPPCACWPPRGGRCTRRAAALLRRAPAAHRRRGRCARARARHDRGVRGLRPRGRQRRRLRLGDEGVRLPVRGRRARGGVLGQGARRARAAGRARAARGAQAARR